MYSTFGNNYIGFNFEISFVTEMGDICSH